MRAVRREASAGAVCLRLLLRQRSSHADPLVARPARGPGACDRRTTTTPTVHDVRREASAGAVCLRPGGTYMRVGWPATRSRGQRGGRVPATALLAEAHAPEQCRREASAGAVCLRLSRGRRVQRAAVRVARPARGPCACDSGTRGRPQGTVHWSRGQRGGRVPATSSCSTTIARVCRSRGQRGGRVLAT